MVINVLPKLTKFCCKFELFTKITSIYDYAITCGKQTTICMQMVRRDMVMVAFMFCVGRNWDSSETRQNGYTGIAVGSCPRNGYGS